MTVNMNLPMRDEVAARLEADAAAASMSRSAYLQALITGERRALKAGELREDTQGPMAGTAPHGGEFSKEDQAGKKKR